ncbi:nucleotidyltransferase domain-containing protein [Paenibacillus sp. CAU 1782]
MSEIIRNELKRLEREEDMTILYACESGSRAWGFPSQDSDYDVRFIYVRRPEWYLSIFDKRDVIERPITDKLDLSGWDLRKALMLYSKSNPPLLEWLQSPLPYLESFSVAQSLRDMSPLAFAPKSCLYHYLNMARGNFRTYLQGETVRLKKYFYVLRPVLACQWIAERGTMPPMEFDMLVNTLLPQKGELRETVEDLLTRKKRGDELDEGPQLRTINLYLAEQLPQLEQKAAAALPAREGMDEQLDELFRSALREVWSVPKNGYMN